MLEVAMKRIKEKEEMMVRFSWLWAIGLMIIVGFITLLGCAQADNSVVADQLEEQLDRVLAGKDPQFDHIDIVEYSDAAVIRGKIAALRAFIVGEEIMERQREKDAEIARIVGGPAPAEVIYYSPQTELEIRELLEELREKD